MSVKKKQVKSQPIQSKEQLIERLLSKAALDFKCCGHGHLKTTN
jgi:hypothetical protein